MPTVKNTIWILEDDEDCQFVYREILASHFDLVFFTHYTDLEKERLNSAATLPQLLIADLKLPEGLLYHLMQESASLFQTIPTLIVSCLDDTEALKRCYELGAVDYITKPFGKNTLLFKVNHLVLKNANPQQQKQLFNRLRNLTLKERLILESLFEHADLSATRKEIISYVWKGVHVSSKTLDVHLYHLRRKIRLQGYDIIAQSNGRMRFCEKRSHSDDPDRDEPSSSDSSSSSPVKDSSSVTTSAYPLG